ncbi:Phage anti-repressor protein [Yersinia pseudotuberculosis]|uniref:Conserved domain protein n=1 Tax=Yersinia pseudotuberculosis serotype O:1b (strain IP 31758) TaxID=349747 RepID=A0A0U1QWA8_YERP3|nr:conserved domain protein [Yersinia pseudotuberculosis IP 31758]AJK18416.1 hypothetical protein BZ19_1216 [Yersinia pseudotuberculosis str. PA3606]RYC28105.1 ORF6N domain-containing protein [Yersinia pseudotuberculosis]CNF46122.1 Phage anti-repressor protein [Yersinia similis]UFA61883.1 Phage ORF6N domain-containing protein [Yersinia pseudotuberculosis]
MTTLAKTVSTNTQSRAISVDSLPSISHNSVPVITTELLANLYGTVPIRIRQSHKRNSDHFICGKHYFKLEGKELADLRVSLSYSQNLVSPKVRVLILWTERGAARHAKMLETDQAWEVFEKLEDCYFNAKAEAVKQPKQKKSSFDERTPLRQYVEKMIANKSGMKYPAIWRLVHDRFDVEHINQLSASESLEAVEFLKVIEGEFIGKQEALPTPKISYPMSFFDSYRWIVGEKALSAPWSYPANLLTPDADYPNPCRLLLDDMKEAGYKVDAALFQLLSLQHHVQMLRKKVTAVERVVGCN